MELFCVGGDYCSHLPHSMGITADTGDERASGDVDETSPSKNPNAENPSSFSTCSVGDGHRSRRANAKDGERSGNENANVSHLRQSTLHHVAYFRADIRY